MADLPQPRRQANASTFSLKILGREQRQARLRGSEVEPEDATTTELRAARPKTRGDCINGVRPCPWVSCRHHLYLDVSPAGSLVLAFPDIEPDQMTYSCSLDIADQEGKTLEEVGSYLGVTRERVRQIEEKATRKVRNERGSLND